MTTETSTLGDTGAAVTFLDRYAAATKAERVMLAAINPAVKGLIARSFSASDRKGMAAWIDKRQGTRNLYFVANPTRQPINRKPEREDVDRIVAVWVDVDPAKSEVRL